MNTPDPTGSRPAISMRMLSKSTESSESALSKPQTVAQSRLQELVDTTTPKHKEIAKKMAAFLASQGFKEQHLDDMIYEIADQICGTLSSHSACENEYQTANQINTQPMVDQIALLTRWLGSEELLQEKLTKDLLVSFSNP